MSDIYNTLYGRSDSGAPSSTIPTQAVDVVAVLNAETFAQLFADARPLEADVYEAAELMEHPLETGSLTADHIVFRPIEISLPLRVSGEHYKDTYAEIRSLYLTATLLTVQTRTGSYDSMIIERMPHRENGESLDSIDIELRLREAKFTAPSFGTLPPRKVASKPQSSTKKKGTQKTTKPNTPTTAKTVATVKAAKPKPRSSALYDFVIGG